MVFSHRSHAFLFFFVILIAFAGAFAPSVASANDKYASIVVDAETGKVLRARNENKRVHPASLTKMMTLYMVFDALSRGQLKLNDRIPISRHAHGMQPSKLNLPVGSSIKVEDAVYALVTKSANDVAAAVAEKLGGSEWSFANRMTAKAKELGMKNTVFKNASGLPDNKQVTTARDMAILARALIYNHPQYYHYFSTKNFSYRGNNYGNHNKLMSTYKGMDGIKTGYIHASGFNLVASAVRNNRRLVAVVFGGRTSKSRNDHMAEILDEGFVLAKKLPQTRIASLPNPARSVRMANLPTPDKKPNRAMEVVLASLEQPVVDAVPARKMAALAQVTASPETDEISDKLDEMLGQGDVDPLEANRLETSLMAMAAHTNKHVGIKGVGEFDGIANDDAVADIAQIERAVDKTVDPQRAWAIQIGAYSSESISGQAIRVASKSLPPELRKNVNPSTVPLTTGSRTIYRARMDGFNEVEAQKACAYLQNCMVIAP